MNILIFIFLLQLVLAVITTAGTQMEGREECGALPPTVTSRGNTARSGSVRRAATLVSFHLCNLKMY